MLLVRTLLIWLLVLTVPAQGAMAATMALCGPGHPQSAAAVGTALAESAESAPVAQLAAQGSAQGHAVGHAHGAVQPGHAHHDGAAETSKPASIGHTQSASPDTQSEIQSCSVCAACCSVSVISSALLPLPLADFAATVFPSLVISVDAFAVGGPERPPRIVLA